MTDSTLHPKPTWVTGHKKRFTGENWECSCGLFLALSRRPAAIAAREHLTDLWLTGEWFWGRVDRSGDCWIWQDYRNARGYGRVRTQRVGIQAHQVAWELTNGRVPEGKELDHLCRNPSCVRPDHLEPVTHRVNMLRGETVGAKNAAKTHCIRGHEFSPANTYRYRGSRECRQCNLIRQRERYAERTAA